MNACVSLKCVRQLSFTIFIQAHEIATSFSVYKSSTAVYRLYCKRLTFVACHFGNATNVKFPFKKLVIYIILITIFVCVRVINWSLWPYTWPTKSTRPVSGLFMYFCTYFQIVNFSNLKTFLWSVEKFDLSTERMFEYLSFSLFYQFERHKELNLGKIAKTHLQMAKCLTYGLWLVFVEFREIWW